MLAVVLAAAFGLEVCLGAFLVTRDGHSTGFQTDSPGVPSVGIAEVMAGPR